jgi:hypothetical protein
MKKYQKKKNQAETNYHLVEVIKHIQTSHTDSSCLLVRRH